MNPFINDDLTPLWNRPPGFLPLRPPGGSHQWSYASVRDELTRVSSEIDKSGSERRVALLANPDLTGEAAVEGLHAGIQMLLGNESAAPHRHTPSALRIGIEATDLVTFVDDAELQLDPLDVVLNPSGTWHGHIERDGAGATWLDIVDLPLVAALGAVLFEPTRAHEVPGLLDPPSVPPMCRYAWSDVEAALDRASCHDGVSTHLYGDGAVLPTLAVTAYRAERGARVEIPRRTCGAVVLAARGTFSTEMQPIEQHDIVALRSWTPFSATSSADGAVLMVVDTAPALRALGLYREESAP